VIQTVLFASVHNAGRSQMAAALFNQMQKPRKPVLCPPEPIRRGTCMLEQWSRRFYLEGL
jgi:hypothetical protein